MTINEATTTITKTKARLTGSGTRLLVLLSALVAGLSISMMMVVAAPVADGDGEVNATMVGAQSAAEREQQQLWCQRRPNEVWSTLDACCQASCYDDAQTICKENKVVSLLFLTVWWQV
jgi:hypothetical protein